MDKKQQQIFYRLCDNFKLYGKKTFIQYRNLSEFKHFEIEKINPDHRIKLYGILRREKVKDRRYNKLVNVGEILIYSAFIIFPFNNMALLFINGFIVYSLLFRLCIDSNPEIILDAYRNRIKSRNVSFLPSVRDG